MRKRLLLFIIWMISTHSYAASYLYIPFKTSFTEQDAYQNIQKAFQSGIRLKNHASGDALSLFYNFIRNGAAQAPFVILPQNLASIGVGVLNGVVFTLDPDANFYPLLQTISQAIFRTTPENDPTGTTRRLLGETLAHLVDRADTRLIVGFPSASSTTSQIGQQTIISATLYRNGLSVTDYINPNHLRQAGPSPAGYTFQPSRQVFPREPIDVVAQGGDDTYATTCNASTQFPESKTRPLRFSASQADSLCAQAPESISADEYLRRVNRHHARKLQPTLSLLLLG